MRLSATTVKRNQDQLMTNKMGFTAALKYLPIGFYSIVLPLQ
jgi:hypothetical protein